jgi:hypothetical protein
MAHFAELDENNVVLRVTVVANEVLLDENNTEQESLGLKHLEHLGGRWVQTSYNNSFRKNYAGIGFLYDSIRNAFLSPKPYQSWILNEDTCNWESPVPHPEIEEGIDEYYDWDENTTSWILRPPA